jgi:hypothetical protein
MITCLRGAERTLHISFRSQIHLPYIQFPRLSTFNLLKYLSFSVVSTSSHFFVLYLVFDTAGHYCYAYPPAMQLQRKQYGAMIYFYRCQLIEGSVTLETKLYTDYAWVTNEEVREYMDEDLADYLTYVLPKL